MEGKDETLSTDVLVSGQFGLLQEASIAEILPPSPAPEPRFSDEAWDRAFNAWRDNWLRSSPVAQNTEGWNYLHSVMGRFRELLEAELKAVR